MLDASIGAQCPPLVGAPADEPCSLLPDMIGTVCELSMLEESIRSESNGKRGVGDRWENIQHMIRQSIHNLRMVTRPDYAAKNVS